MHQIILLHLLNLICLSEMQSCDLVHSRPALEPGGAVQEEALS